MLELRSGDAAVFVAPEAGGRIRQIEVGGLELLLDEGEAVHSWGLFPMVPFAGRIRDGRFVFDGRAHQLPRGMPPHAIHGTLLDRAWTVAEEHGDRALLRAALGETWPFQGEATHDIRLDPDGLVLDLVVSAEERMPVTVGWHPWWRRRLGRGEPAVLEAPAGAMYERDAADIPTGRLLRPPPPGPWDDCFTELRGSQMVRWNGALELTMEHTCDHLVIYDEPSHAVCVEPQTGPPDAVNLGLAAIVSPDRPLRSRLRIGWAGVVP